MTRPVPPRLDGNIDPRVLYPPANPEGVTDREETLREKLLRQAHKRERKEEAAEPAGISVWAELSATLASAAAEVRSHYRKYERMWAHLHQVQITCPLLSFEEPVLDIPELLGPRMGFLWDVRKLVFWTSDDFEGAIGVYTAEPSPTTSAIPPGTLELSGRGASVFFSKGNLLLRNQQRLVFTIEQLGTDPLAGDVFIHGEATQVVAECLPMYLS